MKIGIINGPNLNLLGNRENEIYGDVSFERYFEKLQKHFAKTDLQYFQSNIEGEIVGAIQQFSVKCDGIVLNAAAYTHTSLAVGDAVKGTVKPVVEVHISNLYAREEFRQKSFVAPHAAGIIIGCGLDGYRLAVEYLTKNIILE